MKTRIIEVKNNAGDEWYYAQVKKFFIWWYISRDLTMQNSVPLSATEDEIKTRIMVYIAKNTTTKTYIKYP